ncbi:hypothetical protein [Deinococcus multiflagellatus]|uniref:Uncharacterized protein n=1 Tax=Deinococcus multiflagellatus TaxID=1656887 RepID=A0ABW1ZQU0_9DEIO
MQPTHQALALIRGGFARMSHVRPLAVWLRREMPGLFMLIAHLPGAPAEISDLIMSVPLHVGNAVRWQGRVLGLPGNTGSQQEARALAGKRPQTVHSQTRGRYNQALEAMNLGDQKMVSLAALTRAVTQLAAGEHDSDGAWKALLDSLVAMARGDELKAALVAEVTSGHTFTPPWPCKSEPMKKSLLVLAVALLTCAPSGATGTTTSSPSEPAATVMPAPTPLPPTPGHPGAVP